MSLIVRLSNVGHFSEAPANEEGGHYEREVVLVHAGEFNSMDGPVEITPQIIDLFAANHNGVLAKCKRMATGEIPLKNCPPIQLDHSPSATMTVGRLVGDLRTDSVDIDGKPVKALFGKMRIMGAENIEKVKDGRWTHVSIGADLEAGKVNELSITPFPADANAAMLTKMGEGDYAVVAKGRYKGNKYQIEMDPNHMFTCYFEGGESSPMKTAQAALEWMKEFIDNHAEMNGDKKLSNGGKMKLTERLKKFFKLAEDKDADDKKEKLKKHLMDEEKMSAEDADEKMSKMSDEEMSKLSQDAEDAEKKKLAASDEEGKAAEEKAKMAAKVREDLIRMGKALVASGKDVQLAARKAKVTARLSSIRKLKKITPAEMKKIDVTALAAMSDEQAESIMKTYADREPVLDTDVHGSATAINLAKIAQKYKEAKLEVETRMSMPSKAKEAKKMMGEIAEAEAKEVAAATAHLSAEEKEKELSADCDYNMSYESLCSMLSEGKHEELKAALKKLTSMNANDEGSSDEKQMSELDEKTKHMQTQMKELLQFAGSLAKVDSKEFGE